jgi:aryl-alcohol dehydrogenase-like predicted oxidoreductase
LPTIPIFKIKIPKTANRLLDFDIGICLEFSFSIRTVFSARAHVYWLMIYRTLGTSDIKVSVIGLGTMSWKGAVYGEKPSRESAPDWDATRSMVKAALDCGITLFDTAEGYGRGHAEELLGTALHELGRRDEAVIVTKVGPLFSEEQEGGRTCNLSAAHIRTRCERSLLRLKTDHIDVYLAHWPDPQTPIEETAAVMNDLRREGKIRAFGVSNFSNAELSEALRHTSVVLNQVPYSLVDRKIEAEKVPFCIQHKVSIMAYSPLGKGVLSGKYSLEHLPTDYRRERFHFAKETLPQHLAIADQLTQAGKQVGFSTSQMALAWVVSQPGVALTIAGAKSKDQVRSNAAAGHLTPQVEAALKSILLH